MPEKRSSILLKKLRDALAHQLRHDFDVAFDNGLHHVLSTTSCTSNIARFHGSNGSTCDGAARAAGEQPPAATSAQRAAARPCSCFICRLRRRLVEQELADQLLQHDRRLRLGDAAAVGEHLRVAARIEADVHLAEQARGEDRRDRVGRELVALVDAHRHDRLVGRRDRSARPRRGRRPRPPPSPARATSGRRCCRSAPRAGSPAPSRSEQVADLQREEQDRADADR